MFWCASCSHHAFVLLVQFALDHLKNIEVCLALPETGVAFLQEDNHTHQLICSSNFFVRSMFAFIHLLVDFVSYLTFWQHTIQI